MQQTKNLPRATGTFHATYADVLAFASRWYCFGTVGPVLAYFDANGDLYDIDAPETMDEGALRAIVDDLQDGRTGHRAATKCCADFA